MRLPALVLIAGLMTGCASIYTVRIPVVDEAPPSAASHILIEDLRPESDREVRIDGGIAHCVRMYGDDTYTPPKLALLEQLLAERTPAAKELHVQLRQFDTIEYCDQTAHKAAAAAVAGATGAMGAPIYIPPNNHQGGDTVLIRLKGEVNGVAFDASRAFDYSDLRFGNLPAENPEYRARFSKALREIVAEIAASG